MALAALVTGLMLLAAAPSETVTVEGTRPAVSPDICLEIAAAKAKEWAQARVGRERTDTFADGTTRQSRFIFTENTLYAQNRGLWEAGQVTMAQRRADAADTVARRMDLVDCSKGASTVEAGLSVTTYTYAMGKDLIGRMVVSDATGLPLSMRVDRRMAKGGEPVSIAFRYVYDGDVEVPRGAELAQFQHRMRMLQWMSAQQKGH